MSAVAPAPAIGEDRVRAALERLDPPHPRCGTGRLRVVVLGAGYGGITAALRLARRLKGCSSTGGAAEVVLVDRNPYHLLKTRLPEAAVAGKDVAVSIADLVGKVNVRFVRAEVGQVDLGRRRIVTSAGDIGYDVLVLAIGARQSYANIPGLRANGLTLKTRADAVALRTHLERRNAQALLAEDPEERARLRRIVIAGGGFAGVELAAELADLGDSLGTDEAGEIILLEAGDRLLPDGGPLLSRWATAQLRRRGVRVETDAKLVGAETGMAILSTGERIETGTLLWMGGVQVNDVLRQMEAPTGRLGRVLVDETLQVVGALGVYAVGDAALATDPATGVEVPLTARFAAQQGRYVGDAIAARLRKAWVAPYRPGLRGDAYNIERYLGLASLAFAGVRHGRARTAVARRLKKFPATRHLLRLRSERAAWLLDPAGR